VHVLLSDSEAEHIPGCNMAFRRGCLEAVGGFDAQFRTAGDDVDLCWRLQEQGWTLGFSPAAMVWHHRRNSARAYWRQQRGYGTAEALLERKWPQKYNAAGHMPWRGRLYAKGLAHSPLPRRRRIYFGTWGSGAFQRLYEPADGMLRSLTAAPEWYLLVVLLTLVSGLGLLWPQLLLATPFAVLAAAPPILQALKGAADATFPPRSDAWRGRLARRALTAAFYVIQPLARLRGRLTHGLTPWRRRGPRKLVAPRARMLTAWTEQWEPAAARPGTVEAELLALGAAVVRGDHFDSWDLEVRAGPLGRARLKTAVEEHGAGRQLARYRLRPYWPNGVGLLVLALVGIAVAALIQARPAACAGATAVAAVVGGVAAWDAALALGTLNEATERAAQASPASRERKTA
jgi:Glycosyl transferase family group 2